MYHVSFFFLLEGLQGQSPVSCYPLDISWYTYTNNTFDINMIVSCIMR